MRGLTVLAPGVRTTVQDAGRYGYQAIGVPPAGAMDRDALETANLLVGNDRHEACLECTVGGLEFVCGLPAVMALCGAPVEPKVNGIPAAMYETLCLSPGDTVSLGIAGRGMYAYLAFAGGFAVEPVLGSRSTYVPAGFGGWEGRPLRAGDTLPLREPSTRLPARTKLLVPETNRRLYPPELAVRAIRSHEADRFEPGSVERFFSEPYRVTAQSDRMGCRLDGMPLAHRRGADILSSGVQSGTVQVPGDGKPIVLLADRQTTGGYTRIAHVIQADLGILAQARPGDTVRFVETTLEEARAALIGRAGRLASAIVDTFIPVCAAAERQGPLGPARHFRVRVDGVSYDVGLTEM